MPGQTVHINKGRLHAFRKMTADGLPQHDCHYKLRTSLVSELKSKGLACAPDCVSVAYDWYVDLK